MRAMWSGAVSFGLVSVPVRLYSATTNHDIRFHQVHGVDGGRIRYKRVCEVCGEEVDFADIVKGYETEDGELVTLTEEDLDALPVNSSREIEVVEFVPAEQVDPLLLDKAYYLEPETRAAKPYALLREALRETDRMAVVKVTLRSKEALALLRVRDKVIVMQTILWPDEVREPEFDILDAEVELRPQEMQMAASLVDSLGAEFDPTRFADGYRDAVLEVIERKRSTGETQPTPAAASSGAGSGGGMSDLLSALEASVAAAKSASPASGPSASGSSTGSASSTGSPASGSSASTRSGAGAAVPAQRGAAAADREEQAAAKPASRKPAAEPGARKPPAKKPEKSEKPPSPEKSQTGERKTTRRTRKPA
jgi:DNA end-binding protein Ku